MLSHGKHLVLERLAMLCVCVCVCVCNMSVDCMICALDNGSTFTGQNFIQYQLIF